jgi:hypothetical protein
MPHKDQSRKIQRQRERRAAKRMEAASIKSNSSMSIATTNYNSSDDISELSSQSHHSSAIESVLEENKKLQQKIEDLQKQCQQQMETQTNNLMEIIRSLSSVQSTVGAPRRSATAAAPRMSKAEQTAANVMMKLDTIAENIVQFDKFCENYIYVNDSDVENAFGKRELYKKAIERAAINCANDGFYLPIQCKNQRLRHYYVRNNDEWTNHESDLKDIATMVSVITSKLHTLLNKKLEEHYNKYCMRDEKGNILYSEQKPKLKPEYPRMTGEMYDEQCADLYKFNKKYCIPNGNGGYEREKEKPIYDPMFGEAPVNIEEKLKNQYKYIEMTDKSKIEFANEILPYFKMADI